MTLTEEQKAVIEEILRFKQPIQSLGGYAGTGKTTVIRTLFELLPNWAVCAYTGKAAQILRRKGLPGSTIHSLIYLPVVDNFGRIMLDEDGNPMFDLATKLSVDGIVVDEASMVSKEIYLDLRSFDLPIIFVGDHGQLPPIGETINLMASPDFRLEKIHRNAGEIAWFADYVRRGYVPSSYQAKNKDKVRLLPRYEAEKNFLKVDQIICAYNKTRVEINSRIRQMLGHDPARPVVGDRVICLRNDKRIGVFNGMQGKITELTGRNHMIFEADGQEFDIRFDPNTFGKEKLEQGRFSKDDPLPFDYAYCLTCHKMQGDEADKVMVIEQVCKNWDHSKWAYTAASRAKEQLLWVNA